MKKSFVGGIAAIAMIGMFSVSASAAMIDCPGPHGNGIPYRLVNPHCSGIANTYAGRCLMGHIQPCSVRVTKAYTAYYCEYHGNEIVPGGEDVHYEHTVHTDGNGEISFESYPCPY